MKMNKLVFCFLSLLAADSMALDMPGMPGRTADSTPVDYGSGANPVEPGISTIPGPGCSDKDLSTEIEKEKGQRISLELLQGLAISKKKFGIKKLSGNRFQLDTPRYITACLKLKAEIVPAGSNFFVNIISTHEITESEVKRKDGDPIFSNMSWELKYLRCLEGKGLLKANGDFDLDKAEKLSGTINSGFSPNPSASYANAIGDGKKSVNVYYVSSNMTAFGRNSEGELKNQAVVGDYPEGKFSCVTFENFEDGKPTRLYTSARDEVYDRAYTACQNESAEMILDELSRLKKSTAGNYGDLIKILESAYDGIKNTRAKEIYAEMEQIQKQFNDEKDMPEERAEDLAKKYAELSRQINNLVIAPNSQKIAELMKEDPKGNYEAIKKLGNEIQELYELNKRKEFVSMHEKMKEFALTKEYEVIEGAKLASLYYGRVYKGKTDKNRGSPMTMKQATSEIESRLKQLDSTMEDWDASYASRNGNKAPAIAIRARAKRRKERMDRDYQRFMRMEQSNAQKYCGNNMLGMVKNPTRCRSWMAGKNRRMQSMMKRRGRDLMALRKDTGRYNKYMTNYNDFLDNQAEQGDEYDPFGMYTGSSTYTDYDLYGNVEDYSDDFGWNYSMQNNASVFPGMQQQRNPAAFSPMGQQQVNPFMMQANPYATPFN